MFTWSPVTTMCVSSPSHSRFPFSSIFYRTRSRSRRLVHEISFNNDSKSHRLLPSVDRRPKGNGFTSYLGRRRRQPPHPIPLTPVHLRPSRISTLATGESRHASMHARSARKTSVVADSGHVTGSPDAQSRELWDTALQTKNRF